MMPLSWGNTDNRLITLEPKSQPEPENLDLTDLDDSEDDRDNDPLSWRNTADRLLYERGLYVF